MQIQLAGNGAERGRAAPSVVWRRVAAALIVAGSSVFVAVGATTAPVGASPNPMIESWGDNTYGQLGNGSTNGSSTPVGVSLPGGVTPVAVAAGGYHSLAIGSDNNLYAWGQNGYGQLGNGTTIEANAPVEISLPAGVHATHIAAGLLFSEALGSNGKVYAWGDNSFAELGDGATSNSFTPVAVLLPAGLTFTSIAAGQYHSLALASNGGLYAWGYNSDGQLGDGTKTTPATPVAISLGSGVTPAKIAWGDTASRSAPPGTSTAGDTTRSARWAMGPDLEEGPGPRLDALRRQGHLRGDRSVPQPCSRLRRQRLRLGLQRKRRDRQRHRRQFVDPGQVGPARRCIADRHRGGHL